MTDELRGLLNGYATGNLTSEERERLFRASLEDPALFEALADEEALRELLEDPQARAQLLEATEHAQFRPTAIFRDWLEQPKARVLVAAGLIALAGIGVRAVWERQPFSITRSARVTQTPPVPQMRETAPPESPPPESPPVIASRPVARPPAAPKSAQPPKLVEQVASAGQSELRYTIIRRDAQGKEHPVAPGYTFQRSDVVRLKISAKQRGMLMIRDEAEQVLYAGVADPETPLIAPVQIRFDRPVRSLELLYRPLPEGPTRMPNRFQPMAVRDQPQPVNAVPRTPEESRVEAQTAPPPSSQVSVKLNLRTGDAR